MVLLDVRTASLGDLTIVDTLEARAKRHPERPAFRYMADGTADGEVVTWSYALTARRARVVATELERRDLSGQRVLTMFSPGLDFVAAFYGCLYARAVAVPVAPPSPTRLERTLPKLAAIAADAGATAVLTTTKLKGILQVLGGFAPELAGLDWIATDPLEDDAWRRPDLEPETLAFLQYTSGSTASPKGVMVRHGNLIGQNDAIAAGFGHPEGFVSISWLPVFHDMGLIGHVVHTIGLGGTSVSMAPEAFLRRPLEWLRAIDRFAAHSSGGPDFAYALCARRATDADVAALDLSRWRVAYCGSEPVRQATMRAFRERFEPAGFRPDALVPCYGLAENTLMATTTPGGRGLRTRDGRVGVGRGFAGQRVAIVDPERGVVLPEGERGEIWLQGPSVAAGYFGRPETTAEVFGARTADGRGPWLRTGDLGVMAEDELYVVGRLKDLVIVRGRNLAAEDIEIAVDGCHPAMQPHGVAAFGVEDGREERLTIVGEVRGERDDHAVAEAIRGRLSTELDAPAHDVVLVDRGTLPRTSSGKIQRHRVKQDYVEGRLPHESRVRFDDALDADGPAEAPPTTLPEMKAWLAGVVGPVLGRTPESLPHDVPLESLGMDSLRAVEIASRLDERLGRPLHASVLYSVSTIAALAAWLVEGGPSVGWIASVDPADDQGSLYPDLFRHLGRLESRAPERYRFDLEADIPWDRAGEPGIYVPPAMFRALGMDPGPLEAEPDAWALLQAAAAMTICGAFELVEVTITLFVDTRWSMLGKTRSLELFREEESKHVALFRRCADLLASAHPDLVRELHWDPSWGVGFWELFRAPELFPNERVFHYLFWFFFTAFEEHSIYFANLVGEAEGVQPVWRAAHLAHRREELQHVTTDHAYLGALHLPPEERDAWSEVCVAWLCQHFETFFAFGPARRVVANQFEHLAPALRTGGFVGSPFLQDLLGSPAFRRTRLASRYLRELGEMAPSERPTDEALARRLPPGWLGRTKAGLVPDPVAKR